MVMVDGGTVTKEVTVVVAAGTQSVARLARLELSASWLETTMPSDQMSTH